MEPSIRSINIRGLQIGGTTEIVCDGDDLTTEPRLLLPFAAQQELKTGSTDKKATFSVKLADDVPPGYHQMRIATAGGVSLPIVIGVDRLPQQELKTPIEKLPVAAHGSVSGSSISEIKFIGKKGEPVTIEIEAQRLGSKLRPVLHLYDAKGKQLAWSWSQPALFGDARLETTLPEEGEYRVTCHDLEYAAPTPNFFRLKIGQWTRVDQIFPAVQEANQASELELFTAGGVVKQPATAREILVRAGAVFPLPISAADFSGPRPFLRLSPQPELSEESAAKSGRAPISGPFGISGKLTEPRQEDCFGLDLGGGEKLRLEIFAQRFGSPVDVALVLRNDQGAEVARAEDSPGSLDPILEYTVPNNVTRLTACVIDSQGRGGPQALYHLNIRSQHEVAMFSRMRLQTNLERAALPRGGAWVFPVWLDRQKREDSVEISASGLPAGLNLPLTSIPAGSDAALVTLFADETGPLPDQAVAITHWAGDPAAGGKIPISIKGHPLEELQPWIAQEIAVARLNAAAADFAVDWGNLPKDATLQPTAKMPLPVKLTRVDQKSPVRLTLLAGQRVTMVNNQPDPKTTLRAERAVELAANQNEGELSLLVPAELVSHEYDLAIQAELLTPDKQKVLATAFTPVKRLAVQMPVELQLAGENRFEISYDTKTGATQKIEGTIKRREGITGDVVVRLENLPAGLSADSPTVKADQTSFTVTVTIAPNITTAFNFDSSLTASIAPDAKQPAAVVKSRPVKVLLVTFPNKS